jgi:DNA-binding NarL/FixJ family response regulator
VLSALTLELPDDEAIIASDAGHTFVMRIGDGVRISSDDPLEFVRQIKLCRTGGWEIDPAWTSGRLAVIVRQRDAATVWPCNLSSNEVWVLVFTFVGFTAREISEEMGLAIRTVAVYRLYIRRKLGLERGARLTAPWVGPRRRRS